MKSKMFPHTGLKHKESLLMKYLRLADERAP